MVPVMREELLLGPAETAVLECLRAWPTPFTTSEALAAGATFPRLRAWAAAGLLAHPLRGVYHSPLLPDDLELRLAVLRLVVPEDCVVTDRTAGWLWGANMILAPGDHQQTPKVSVFSPPGHRLRNGLAASGERQLAEDDVVDLAGLRVTTPLRTAGDLGRLLHRDQAFAALDSLAGLRMFTADDLLRSVVRFAGYRGVVQLRALAPLVDPDAQSPGESVLRLRWIDLGLERPQCQVPVPAPNGATWWLDMGLPERRFAAEYDGEEFHGDAQEAHDTWRRDWLRRTEGWTIVVARKQNVYGRSQDVDALLRTGAAEAGIIV